MTPLHSRFTRWPLCAALALVLGACSPETQVRRTGAPATENASEGSSAAQSLKQGKIPRLETVAGEEVDETYMSSEEASLSTDVAGAYLRQPSLKEMGKAIAVKVHNTTQKISWELYELILQRPLVDDPQMMVMYQVEHEGKTVFGLIPRNLLKVQNESIIVPLRGPGVYRAVATSTLMEHEPTHTLDHSSLNSWLQSSQLMALNPTPSDIHVVDNRLYISQNNSVTSYESAADGWKKLASYSFGAYSPQQLIVTRNRIYGSEPKTGLASYQLPATTGTNPPAGLRPVVDSALTTHTFGIALSGPTRNMYLLEEAPSTLSPARLKISRFDIQQVDPIFEESFHVGVGSSSGLSGEIRPRILVAGANLYLLFENGLLSLDVTNNDQFTQLNHYSRIDRPTAFAIHPSQNRLYISDRVGNIHVIDVTDPRNPSLIQQLKFEAKIVDLLVVRNHLFAIDSDRLIHRFEIGSTLLFKDNYALEERPTRISAFGNELLIAVSNKGIQRLLLKP